MVNKWDIYYCSLNPTQGSEQRGTRPVIVVSNDAVNHNITVSTVIPLSSYKVGSKTYPTEVFLDMKKTLLPKDSLAMLQQIRTVDHRRLIKKIANISDDDIRQEISQALKDYFEL